MKHSNLSPRSGFTLLELIIFAGVFSLTAIVFITILVTVVRVQSRQGAVKEVTEQSHFLLQRIQYLVEQSSVIEMTTDTPTNTLKLRMASSSADPTYVYLLEGVVFYKETETGIEQPLTTSRVNVSSLTFTKRANTRGHDSVSVSFLMERTTQNIQQKFAQFLQTSVARVSAATFDSNLVPAAGNTYKIGLAAQDWQSINNTIYFSGANVGVGTSNPGQTLEVNGGVRLSTSNLQPSCSAAQRGTLWYTQSAGGVKDKLEVCVKNASDVYVWAPIY